LTGTRNIAPWAIGLIISGTGIWCLYLTVVSAIFALSPGGINGMPNDMRITALISIGVMVIFSCLFLLSGASSMFLSQRMQIHYQPTLLKVMTLILLIVLSVFAQVEYEATSKISWAESRGIPFAFLNFTEIRAVCNAGIEFWKCRSFENLNPLALIIDLLIIYSVVCVTTEILSGSRITNPKW